ncbi:hypothetical protein D3C72_2512810 [compost metagenome]
MILPDFIGILIGIHQAVQALTQNQILMIVDEKFQLMPELQLVTHFTPRFSPLINIIN